MRAIGLLEFKEITRGVYAADVMLKGAPVELLLIDNICPGKLIVLIGGEVSAVKNAISRGKEVFNEGVIEEVVLTNPHPSLSTVFLQKRQPKKLNYNSIGIIETLSVSSAIKAADKAVKGANAEIIDIKIARFLGGKAIVVLGGEISAVKVAIDAGISAVQKGKLVSSTVVANINEKLLEMWV
ncbi:MAG: Microcompartments protein [Caldanaerobacter subterraneus]|nr:MAG: Microcompartments protein [Caldanaerobacter subterraneus]HAA80323.1 microcompartment protein [Thermoanaerobacter sp.]